MEQLGGALLSRPPHLHGRDVQGKHGSPVGPRENLPPHMLSLGRCYRRRMPPPSPPTHTNDPPTSAPRRDGGRQDRHELERRLRGARVPTAALRVVVEHLLLLANLAAVGCHAVPRRVVRDAPFAATAGIPPLLLLLLLRLLLLLLLRLLLPAATTATTRSTAAVATSVPTRSAAATANAATTATATTAATAPTAPTATTATTAVAAPTAPTAPPAPTATTRRIGRARRKLLHREHLPDGRALPRQPAVARGEKLSRVRRERPLDNRRRRHLTRESCLDVVHPHRLALRLLGAAREGRAHLAGPHPIARHRRR